MRISYWSSDVCSSDLTYGMAEAVAAVLVLEADIRGLGETGAQIVRRPRLQRLAVLHHRFDRIGRDGAGKTLILGLFAGDHGQRQRRSEEHTSELQSLMRISYAVFGLKKKSVPQTSDTNSVIAAQL